MLLQSKFLCRILAKGRQIYLFQVIRISKQTFLIQKVLIENTESLIIQQQLVGENVLYKPTSLLHNCKVVNRMNCLQSDYSKILLFTSRTDDPLKQLRKALDKSATTTKVIVLLPGCSFPPVSYRLPFQLQPAQRRRTLSVRC